MNKIYNFKEQFSNWQKQVEEAIDKYLPSETTRPAIIHEAMRYSMQAGGKRLRPVLILAGSSLFETDQDPFAACVAIECLHTYSLIHDDLPCMDNSDLRRGRPTCHKKFDEPMALLAGDSLLTYAFYLLSHHYKSNPTLAAGLVEDLSDASSSAKLIGGQVEDIIGEKGEMNLERLEFIHENKTAALITSAITMGVRLAGKNDEKTLAIAKKIGYYLGLSFQVIDDILDATSDEETLGKTVGIDEKNHKLTYVTLYGLDKAKQIASDLTQKCLDACDEIGGNTQFLKDLVAYMENRIN